MCIECWDFAAIGTCPNRWANTGNVMQKLYLNSLVGSVWGFIEQDKVNLMPLTPLDSDKYCLALTVQMFDIRINHYELLV